MSAGETPATRWLTARGIAFGRHTYDYRERGGAEHAAETLGIPAARVVKTLVMETDRGDLVLVLMHGDRRVAPKKLARALSVRRVTSASPETALTATGYHVGGISPFGTARELRVVMERSILDTERVWINGGRRGLLLEIESAVLRDALGAEPVEVAAEPHG